MSASLQERLGFLQPRMTKYIPHKPTPKQAAFLVVPHKEAFYGGAAGGGKSDALLMAALQYVDTAGYAAIIFRRTYADLSLPGALMDRANEWLSQTDAHWSDKDKTWTFPSGATLTFGYLEHEKDKFRYQSSEFQFIGFDELTQFSETQYTYLFSRLRRTTENPVPLRMRGAANPGGVGHEWVRQRFIVNAIRNERIFIPAGLVDNPHLNQEEYRTSLMELDSLTRRQLLDGDWSAKQAGSLFHREWFTDHIVDGPPANAKMLRQIRFWDLAATDALDGDDPDYTVGLLLGLCEDGNYYILHVNRFRKSPHQVEKSIAIQAAIDGRLSTSIWMEQEPGASGKITIDNFRRNILRGYVFRGDRPTGSKLERARPVSAAAEAGLIKLVRGPWLNALLDELEAFPYSNHKDQVDALSGAYAKINVRMRPTKRTRTQTTIWS